ncbi:MAG TPA: TolC family protein [Candidatus Sulfotelmatobacter sp.]
MSRHSKSRSALLAGATLSLVLQLGSCALAQSAPVSWNHPWHSSDEQRFVRDALAEHIEDLPHNAIRTYSLAELIDMAESNNPETRVAWERARAQAASLGVARSELYPTLAAAALSQTSREEIFFGSRFYGQRAQDFEVALDLSYTILDFGARRGRINAARAQLLAANFAFNDTHRIVIYQVEQSYYRLLSSMGQEDAARASLSNAEAVQEAAEDRLAHGLATLPDVLEARSATAQAEYDLQSVLGAEAIARGDLATAVGDRASLTIKVQPLDQLPMPDSMSNTVEDAIDRAVSQRPDLMQQVAEIRSANARVQEARSAYYPALSLNASPTAQSDYGIQSPYDWAHTAGLTGGLSFNLKWTIFDGGARKNTLLQARSNVREAEAQAEVKRNQIADEVWTAYSNLNTALRQRKAAVALLGAASQSYEAALQSYNYGVRSLLDVTAAQRTLAQARSADVYARTQVLTSFAGLAFRTGDSIQSTKRSQP